VLEWVEQTVARKVYLCTSQKLFLQICINLQGTMQSLIRITYFITNTDKITCLPRL